MSLRKILLIGKSNAGKGTQAKLLKHFGFKHISTGELIEEAREKRDPLVLPYEEALDEGRFLPDKEIFQLLYQEIGNLDNERGYILDGAVRNMAQAERALQMGILEEALIFNISDEEVKKREPTRNEEQDRKDDRPGPFLRKLQLYKTETEPIIPYLEKNGILVYEIDASKSEEKVHKEIIGALRLD